MYGSTEGTVGLMNTDDQVGAVGFVSKIFPVVPFNLIKLDENGLLNNFPYAGAPPEQGVQWVYPL